MICKTCIKIHGVTFTRPLRKKTTRSSRFIKAAWATQETTCINTNFKIFDIKYHQIFAYLPDFAK